MNNEKTMAKTLALLANAEMQDRGCFRYMQNLALCRFDLKPSNKYLASFLFSFKCKPPVYYITLLLGFVCFSYVMTVIEVT